MEFPICDKLLNLKNENRTPFHMPGHKRKPCLIHGERFPEDITSLDITEITDYDNLHHPEGMILESMNLLKNIYHSKKSWYLVNGSTVGLLVAISAVCEPGDSILVARNSHKAVYNAIRLLHLKPIYIYPEYSFQYDMMQGIRSWEVESALSAHGNVKAVLLTSPSYEGIVSDISSIKKIAHRYHVPLIVDEAHGAHFVFHDYFPQNSIECGADLVIQSAHKTLPSFTQTALLHYNSEMISLKKIEEMLSIYQTSSPSYLLMASAEYGVLYTQSHADKVQEYVDKLMKFRSQCAQLKNVKLLEREDIHGYDYDRGKLVFIVEKMSGKELFDQLLERFHIECEMAAGCYCIAMTSINDDKEDFARLWEALYRLDQEMEQIDSVRREPADEIKLFATKPLKSMEPWEAVNATQKHIPFEHSAGNISASYLYLYPPGIPVVVPGEKITKEIVANMKYYLYNGYNVPELSKGTVTIVEIEE